MSGTTGEPLDAGPCRNMVESKRAEEVFSLFFRCCHPTSNTPDITISPKIEKVLREPKKSTMHVSLLIYNGRRPFLLCPASHIFVIVKAILYTR